MDFFIKPFQQYAMKHVLNKHLYVIMKPILFIGGNMLYLRAMKYLTYNVKSEPISIPVDPTKDYIDKSVEKFKSTFDNSKINESINANIQKEFYVKEEYAKSVIEYDNEIERAWKKKALIENTPRGNIIMFYDPYKMGFSYYSDAYSIPYNVLNAVAMKYVIIYHCRDFFVDDEITPERAPSPFIQLHMIDKKKNSVNDASKTTQSSKSAFAKLKNYKKTNTVHYKDEKPANYRNRFICLGKTTNYSILQKVATNKRSSLNGFHSNMLNNLTGENDLQMKVLSYKDFKNRIQPSQPIHSTN
jgi:hypothetical protein